MFLRICGDLVARTVGGCPARGCVYVAFAGLLACSPTLAQVACDFTQITETTFNRGAFTPSLDEGLIAFRSSSDLTGDNPDLNFELFLFDGASITQVTDTPGVGLSRLNLDGDSNGRLSPCIFTGPNVGPSLEGGSIAFESRGGDGIFLFDGASITQIAERMPLLTFVTEPSLDGNSIAFRGTADLTGGNPDGNSEIFLFDGVSVTQITDSVIGDSFEPSLDGDSIAFTSTADLTGNNPDLSSEIFLFDGASITQITDSLTGESSEPSLDAGSIAFTSDADLTGNNPEGRPEIFLFDGVSIRQITDAFLCSDSPSLDGGSVAFRSITEIKDFSVVSEIFLYDSGLIVQVTDSQPHFVSQTPSLDGDSIAFTSNSDLTGENPDHHNDVFLATCQVSPLAIPTAGSFSLWTFVLLLAIAGELALRRAAF